MTRTDTTGGTTAPRPLSVLIIEDDDHDATLVKESFRMEQVECQFRRVETAGELKEALLAGPYDVVLADGNLPTFSGVEALKIVRERHAELPFIFVSGSIAEDLASDMLKMGATDFISKNRLARLPPSVLRSVQESTDRARRRLAEAALRDSETRYRRLFEDAPAPMYIHCAGMIVAANAAAARVLGAANADELLGASHLEFVAAGASKAAGPSIEGPAGSPEALKSERQWMRRDGEAIFVEAAEIPTAFGDRPAVHVIFADVTERKKAEQALAEAEEKYRSIVENAVEGIFQATLDDRYLMVNPALATMLGYASVAELMSGVTDVKQHFAQVDQLDQAKRLLREKGVLRNFEFEMRRKNGETFWISSTVRAVFDAQGQFAYVEGMAEDVGERKRLENELRQAQKMEAVGQLAGGVAHDFNNILTAIIGYSDFLRDAVGSDDRLSSMVAEIRKAADRAASLTRQLLAFSRKQVLQPKVFKFSGVVTDMEKMLRRLIGEDIEVVVQCDANTGHVNADPGQMEQVLMNLVVNARDAMPDGGTLTIQTRAVIVDTPPERGPDALPVGRYVLLTVRDTGCGIDAKTRTRIFEPFFTTKGPGKGTGLGLSTVYGIIKQSGGHVSVDTELGRGTCFWIYLPQVSTVARAESSRDVAHHRGGASEVILLVEDDPVVRGLTQRILEKYGYGVLPADSPKAAVRVAEEHEGMIDLLLTDVVLPGQTGRELAERLVTLRQGLKVIYMSGYNDNVVARHGVLDPGVHFLPKPFTMEDLLDVVRGVLDAGDTSET